MSRLHKYNIIKCRCLQHSFIAGLFAIIQMRQKLFHEKSTPILLLAPNEMKSWLMFYDSEIEPICSEFEFIDNRALVRQIKRKNI